MIDRDYSDKDLRAALGSSPPLEKMKMGHTKADQWFDNADRARDRKTERDAAQVLIAELVGALELVIGSTKFDVDNDLTREVTRRITAVLARAKASHGAGT